MTSEPKLIPGNGNGADNEQHARVEVGVAFFGRSMSDWKRSSTAELPNIGGMPLGFYIGHGVLHLVAVSCFRLVRF